MHKVRVSVKCFFEQDKAWVVDNMAYDAYDAGYKVVDNEVDHLESDPVAEYAKFKWNVT